MKNVEKLGAWLSWGAMIKFSQDKSLTDAEWEALSHLTLIDRERLVFEPGNCRWAESKAEAADNLKFYKSLGGRRHGVH